MCYAMQTGPELSKGVLIRDLLIFQLKLWMDGVKDLVLAPVSVGAGVLDILLGPNASGYRLYSVLRLGERYDLWLNLFGAAKAAEVSGEGLFGGSEPGDGTMLGKLEELSAGSAATVTFDRRDGA
ncbi:hypothetical protein BH23GEM6_BH23GEM6_08560 [soil metagenome]